MVCFNNCFNKKSNFLLKENCADDRVNSHVKTSQMCSFPSGNYPKVRLRLLRRQRLQFWPSVAVRQAKESNAAVRTGYGTNATAIGQPWEVAAWNIVQLGSCHMGKYPGEVATWGKTFWKVSNTFILYLDILNRFLLKTFDSFKYFFLDKIL